MDHDSSLHIHTHYDVYRKMGGRLLPDKIQRCIHHAKNQIDYSVELVFLFFYQHRELLRYLCGEPCMRPQVLESSVQDILRCHVFFRGVFYTDGSNDISQLGYGTRST